MSKLHVQAALLMVVLFVLGAVSGVAIDRVWLSPHPARPHDLGPPMPERGPPDPERLVSHLREDLNLTPAQAETARAAMREANQKLEQLRMDSEPRVRAALEEARKKIDAVLTPEQLEKLKSRAPHPDGRMMPPGPPPEPFGPPPHIETSTSPSRP